MKRILLVATLFATPLAWAESPSLQLAAALFAASTALGGLAPAWRGASCSAVQDAARSQVRTVASLDAW